MEIPSCAVREGYRGKQEWFAVMTPKRALGIVAACNEDVRWAKATVDLSSCGLALAEVGLRHAVNALQSALLDAREAGASEAQIRAVRKMRHTAIAVRRRDGSVHAFEALVEDERGDLWWAGIVRGTRKVFYIERDGARRSLSKYMPRWSALEAVAKRAIL